MRRWRAMALRRTSLIQRGTPTRCRDTSVSASPGTGGPADKMVATCWPGKISRHSMFLKGSVVMAYSPDGVFARWRTDRDGIDTLTRAQQELAYFVRTRQRMSVGCDDIERHAVEPEG